MYMQRSLIVTQTPFSDYTMAFIGKLFMSFHSQQKPLIF